MEQQLTPLKFKTGLKDGFPIGLGYLSVSFAIGVSSALPIFITVLMSFTNLTSAGQKAGIDIIAVSGSFLELIAAQIVINSRYFLMSASLTQKTDYTFTIPQRFLCAAFVTDEIFGVAISKKQKLNKNYFLGLAILPVLGWTLGTLLGGILGDILPAVITDALGIALYAMFIAIIIPPAVKDWGVLAAVIISISLSCLFYYLPCFSVISEGFKVIICALVASCILAVVKPVKEEEDAE